MAGILAVSLILVGAQGIHAAQDDGQPFGRMNEKDFESFTKFANERGLDLEAEMQKVYKGDAAAMARVFEFSTRFETLDQNARAYGNLLYSTFLNIAEAHGEEPFVSALALVSDGVRQRARDFFYYPIRKVPKKHRAEVEKETRAQFSRLFPADYVFGKNDALFD